MDDRYIATCGGTIIVCEVEQNHSDHLQTSLILLSKLNSINSLPFPPQISENEVL